MNPLCFVLMPFGRKFDSLGRNIDFDAVYSELIAKAGLGAGLDVIRADEEQVGGTIHKPMFERLLLCEYAIADLTGLNPNVFYELGVRHALRPRTTLILFAEGTQLPFDVAPLRGIPYGIDESGRPVRTEESIRLIRARLEALRQDQIEDSPVYQLIDDMPRVEVDHAKTDLFRHRVRYSQEFKDRLAKARAQGAEAVRAVIGDKRLENVSEVEAGVVVDVFLSLRDVKDHAGMLEWYEKMPRPLQRTRMVQEQRAFALNRLKQSREAEHVLRTLIAEHGPSSETNGLLGRVYKDRWEEAKAADARARSGGELRQAIDAYLAGFEADWRDPYPGINAVTLMEMLDKPDPRQNEVLPVVRYAARQRARRAAADYWDQATLLELAVLARDEEDAGLWLGQALSRARAGWELETTARNLSLLAEMREAKGEDVGWLRDIVSELSKTASTL
jgi:hypothetical protein